MKLEFLWDEDKTRKLFKTHLILFLVGSIVASIYTLLLPPSISYRLIIIAIPAIIAFSCLIFFLLLPKPNPGLRFLLFTLEAQLAAAIFMAITGGFLGIVQFAPYMFILFAVFELGVESTLILGVFSVLTFIGILIWNLSTGTEMNIFQHFFYYVGSYILIVAIEHNIGKELSLQFEAKKKLEQIDDLKNQFITLTSHYLRTPLTIIKGLVSEQEQSPINQQQKVRLLELDTNIRTLENMIEKLLTISAIEKGQAKIALLPSNLNNLLLGVVAEFTPQAQQQKIALIYQPSLQPIPQFPFDPVKLKTAISSLLDNAIKYNKPAGTVTVSTAFQKKWVVIQVADTGQGIKKDSLEYLFSTFNRGGFEVVLDFNKPGMGLSLYLTKLIVEAHGGKINVQTEEGLGSTFTITLPLLCKPPRSKVY